MSCLVLRSARRARLEGCGSHMLRDALLRNAPQHEDVGGGLSAILSAASLNPAVTPPHPTLSPQAGRGSAKRGGMKSGNGEPPHAGERNSTNAAGTSG